MKKSQYENLAQALHHLSATWHLDNIRPLGPSSFTHNYVAVAYSHDCGADVVIKICPEGIDKEQKAIAYFQEHSCVKLITYDTSYHGILLEYVQPGTTLKTHFPHNEEDSIRIFAEIVASYAYRSIASSHTFPTNQQWLHTLHTHISEIIPRALLQRAAQISQELITTQSNVCVLHGDLHHENILQQDNHWIMIDPKGVVGEVAYELAPFIRNPIPQLLENPDAHNIVKNRVERLSELFRFDQQRILRWSFVQTVLAACWAEENERHISKYEYHLRFASLIENMI